MLKALCLVLFSSRAIASQLTIPETRDRVFGISTSLSTASLPADSSTLVCRDLPSTSAQTVTYPGAALPVQWETASGKSGDCAFYLSFDYAGDQTTARDASWYKIADIPECHKLSKLDGAYVPIPEWAKAGPAVLRWEFVALGDAQKVEFYANCVDLLLQRPDGTGVGTDKAAPVVKIPGHLPSNRSGFQTKSKRQTLKVKYMIEKKVKAHKQKMKKFSKTNKQLNKNHKKSSKDPGIPNLFPYKAELMQKIMKDKEVAKQKGMQVNQLLHEPAQENMDYSSDEYEGYEQDFQHQDLLSNKHSTAGSYFKELNKVLNECDVVLEVLDARDPLGCRCRQIERRIVEESGKKLVLVLNKIDMVPNEVAESWIAYLKREFPTIAFKASTQTQKSKTAVFGGRLNVAGVKKELANTSQCLGGNELIQLLKNYCRSKDIKTSITVGVIGYPNVGKSSIINSLKRSRAVAVGSTPGLTKDVQEVHLDKNIKLLDSPGVIFFDDPNSTESSLALRNSLKLERLEDPVGVVHEMIKKVPKAQLLSVFQLDSFNSADEFVLKIAAQKGKLKKGGIPDIYAASISILRDWNEGKIPFYTIPPAIPESEHASQARVVSDYAAEFDIAALESGNSMVTTLSSSSASAPVEPRIRDQTYQLAVDVEMH